MPLIKTYLIVTNNALELPVMVDIRGVKEAADYVTLSNDEEGVAKFIEKYVLD